MLYSLVKNNYINAIIRKQSEILFRLHISHFSVCYVLNIYYTCLNIFSGFCKRKIPRFYFF
jgi:hypothetical protein